MNIQTTPQDAASVSQLCAQLASDKKADNVVILDVSKLTSYADRFVICSAPSERQVQAIARFVETETRQSGVKPIGVEGLEEGNWVLIDFGDVVLHVFLDSARWYYDLENFWVDAPRIPLNA